MDKNALTNAAKFIMMHRNWFSGMAADIAASQLAEGAVREYLKAAGVVENPYPRQADGGIGQIRRLQEELTTAREYNKAQAAAYQSLMNSWLRGADELRKLNQAILRKNAQIKKLKQPAREAAAPPFIPFAPRPPQTPPPAVYGHCPHCGHIGLRRERRPNGNDTCTNGHVYPSASAVKREANG